MNKFLKFLIVLLFIGGLTAFLYYYFNPRTSSYTKHQLLLDRVEAMGKLELIKYRYSDVLEHKNVSTFLPDASVLLIVKADAVGCIDLTRIKSNNIEIYGDSVSIKLPAPEVCYVKIDHNSSKVYDTKMAFFRESELVDEAYKSAEKQITAEVRQSDILQQTKNNAVNVLKPLVQALGFPKSSFTFE